MPQPGALRAVAVAPPGPLTIHASLAASGAKVTASPLGCYALRLVPGDLLVASLSRFVLDNNLQAPFVLTCVGRARKATVRLASATPEKPNEIITLNEYLEILSLVGTLTPPSRNHLHISFGDKTGRVIGGHLIEMEVFTTAEIVLGECHGLTFDRPHDERTGWDELTVAKRFAARP